MKSQFVTDVPHSLNLSSISNKKTFFFFCCLIILTAVLFLNKTEEERTVVFTGKEVKRCNDPFRCRLISNLFSNLLLVLVLLLKTEKKIS